jgi:hypothetical protein
VKDAEPVNAPKRKFPAFPADLAPQGWESGFLFESLEGCTTISLHPHEEELHY